MIDIIKSSNLFEEKEFFHPLYLINNWYAKQFIHKINKRKLEIIFTNEKINNKISNHPEISFCDNYYNGKFLYTSSLSDILVKTGSLFFNDYMNSRYIQVDYVSSKLDRLIERCHKYYNRGFDIFIDIDILKKLDNNSYSYSNINYVDILDECVTYKHKNYSCVLYSDIHPFLHSNFTIKNLKIIKLPSTQLNY